MPPDRLLRQLTANSITSGATIDLTAAGPVSADAPRIALTESLDLCVLGATKDGFINYAGAAATQLFTGATPSLMGARIPDLFGASHQDELDQALNDAANGRQSLPIECAYTTAEGDDLQLAVTMFPAQNHGDSLDGVAVVIRDLSEQRWMSSTLDATLHALRNALEDARQSEERSKRFLSDAAHQLRTPMAGIRACAEMLLAGTPVKHRERLMTVMIRETERGSDLMASLLAMSRLDQGPELRRVSTDIVELCRLEAERAGSLAPHLQVAVHATKDIEPLTLDDKATIEMVANLLDNARRHATSRIDISLERAGETVRIAVADDGKGVPPGIQQSMFDRFVSLDGKGGSGLGLPIAQGIARAQGGDLVYENGTFIIDLPIESPSDESTIDVDADRHSSGESASRSADSSERGSPGLTKS